ncbi:MAG: hypothetical protein GVY13_17285 [Alphaproteobacteria bacterium]|jgi:predicted nucleotidyltransferase|nr:hypothetical protein [Alphaproteobacteria bacterium]
MLSRDEIIRRLRRHQPELRAAGIVHLALFGSAARGDPMARDIDPAARFDPARVRSLLDHARAWDVVAHILDHEVDLIDLDSTRPDFRRTIDNERVDAF